jgi:glycosyltransferase involved in cell wall biosynthesis
MEVLFLAWRDLAHPLAGGSEVLVDELAKGLTERGHRVELLCGDPAAPHRAYGATGTGGTYTQYLRAPARYLRHHRHVDLVVDVANGVPFFSPIWRRRPSLCLVNQLHTALWPLWFPAPVAAVGRRVEAQLMPAVYRDSLFVAVSPSTADALTGIGIDPTRVRVVPNGVKPCRCRPFESPEPLFLAIGRLVPHKRFELLLRMWDTVRPHTGGRLVIVGDGPELARLRSLAGPGASLPGRVTEDEKHALLAKSWMLLHPSLVEGWGLVVMEAAACGTPTVGFDVDGLRDSVADGETGALARSEEGFARAWVTLAGDHAARQALGRQARRRSALFPWTSTVDRFMAVAEEAVARQAGTASTSLPDASPQPVPSARR